MDLTVGCAETKVDSGRSVSSSDQAAPLLAPFVDRMGGGGGCDCDQIVTWRVAELGESRVWQAAAVLKASHPNFDICAILEGFLTYFYFDKF